MRPRRCPRSRCSARCRPRRRRRASRTTPVRRAHRRRMRRAWHRRPRGASPTERLRFQTVSGTPAATRRPAIAVPIRPRPRNPRAVMLISLLWTESEPGCEAKTSGYPRAAGECGGYAPRAVSRHCQDRRRGWPRRSAGARRARSARALIHEGGVHAAVGLRAIPEPVHQVAENDRLGARVGGEVEGAVEGEELFGIGRSGHLLRPGPRGGRGRTRPDLGRSYAAAGARRAREHVDSSHSGRLRDETRAPLLATSVTRPSAASIRSASRTGARLAPVRSAICSCRTRAPGTKSPRTIASRSRSAMWAVASPCSGWRAAVIRQALPGATAPDRSRAHTPFRPDS